MANSAIRELAGLVEHFQWHRGLAEVVHQSTDAGEVRLPFVEVELMGQRKHQGADGDRMQIGVIVVGLQPRHAEQSHGMALDRGGDFVDQGRVASGSIALPRRAAWNMSMTWPLAAWQIRLARSTSAAIGTVRYFS